MSVLSWSSARSSKVLVGVAALAALGVGASMALSGPAAAGSDGHDAGRQHNGWPTHILSGDAGAYHASADAKKIRVREKTVRQHFTNADGNDRFNAGDYIVFLSRLRQGGDRVGRDSVECMLMIHSFSCEGSLQLNGRGSIEVSGTTFFKEDRFVLAVTGGTGEFNAATGKLTALRRSLVIELN